MIKLEQYLQWAFGLIVDGKNIPHNMRDINKDAERHVNHNEFNIIRSLYEPYRDQIETILKRFDENSTGFHAFVGRKFDFVPYHLYEVAHLIIDQFPESKPFMGETQLAKYEASGDGFYGFRIMGVVRKHFEIEGDEKGEWKTLDLSKPEEIGNICVNTLCKLIEQIKREINLNDPEGKAKKKAGEEMSEKALPDFKGSLMEELPNGYCDKACCVNIPWYRVYTQFGSFIIGWRKRVINIDVSGMPLMKGIKLSELFPGEETTKEDSFIHAWGYDKAKAYLKVIINHCESLVPKD